LQEKAMCGDVEEDGPGELEEHLFNAFLVHTRRLLAEQAKRKAEPGSPSAYADKLFADALSRCQRDGEAAEPDKRYSALALQPLVFARLAGFLASHLALNEDPLRKVMEAMMHGYSEAERLEPDHGHDHDHHHDDHDHGHSHHHHH
jgi:hypothetical protein